MFFTYTFTIKTSLKYFRIPIKFEFYRIFNTMSNKWPKIILFGDSQVQRSFEPNHGLWGALLANRFQRVCDVIPRGFSGYTSRSGLIVMPSVFPENLPNVEAFVIFFGTNDYSGVEDPSGHHVPVEEYSKNLKSMIEYLQTLGVNNEKIILITPGPYCDEKFMETCEKIGRTFPKRDKDLVLKYVEECKNISREYKVNVINIHEEIMKDKDWKKYLLDGVHFSRDGSFLIYNQLLPLLEKKINTGELFLPYWRDINHIHPQNVTPDLYGKKCPSMFFPVENLPLEKPDA